MPLLLRLVALVCLASSIARADDEILGQGDFRYRVVNGWAAESLAKVAVKNGHAVAIDTKGRLLFLTDDPRNNVIILDRKTGDLLGHWTARMPGAHGMALAMEPNGREVLFITDTALHEVRKLTLDGEELARYPWPESSGLYAKADEYRPSKVLCHPNGQFWVFDGYGKDYIHHYSAEGKWLRAWGGNIGPPEDQLKHWGPHGGALDLRDPATPSIVIGMSDQQQIKRFTLDGKFLNSISFPGGNPRDVVFWGDHAIIPHLGDQWPKDKSAPGFLSIVNRADYTVVSNVGAPPAICENGALQPMKSDGKTFIHPHAVAVDTDGNLFVAQFASPAMPLMKLERISPAQAAKEDIIVADFETADLAGWSAKGDAFTSGPLHNGKPKPFKFTGAIGQGVAGTMPGQEPKPGTLTSPLFKIERRYLNYITWGQRNIPAKIGVELLIDGRVVRAAAATEFFDPTLTLHPRTFDVREFAGQQAQLRINDQSKEGAIVVDQMMQSDKAQTQPVDASVLGNESFRPQFHYTAQSGWLNDANGLFFYQGVWHLFHQHRPPGAAATLWGHATSSDLLHWEHLPSAILNEERDAIFSGSGAVDWTNSTGLKRGEHPPILLFYTLHPAGDSGRKATQAFAFSIDGGKTFEKFAGNPVLRTADNNDRDPKAFFHAPSQAWFMVLSLSRNNIDRDHATYGLYRSRDAKSWELLQEIGPGAWYWECPDMFELPIDGDPQRTKWVLMKGSGDYVLGTLTPDKFVQESEPIRTQWSGSYYGAMTFSDAPNNRRIQIAWMNSSAKAETPNAYPGMPFNQQMSFPRELTLRSTPDGPRVFRYPIPEIKDLYSNTQEFQPGDIAAGQNALAGVKGELLDLDIGLDLGTAKKLEFDFRGDKATWDVAAKQFTIGGRHVPVAATGRVNLRLLLDRTSVEIFINKGEVDIARVFWTDPANKTLSLVPQGGTVHVHQLVAHELKSIWRN